MKVYMDNQNEKKFQKITSQRVFCYRVLGTLSSQNSYSLKVNSSSLLYQLTVFFKFRRTLLELRESKRNNILLLLVSVLDKTFTSQVVQVTAGQREVHKKVCYTCKVVVLLINVFCLHYFSLFELTTQTLQYYTHFPGTQIVIKKNPETRLRRKIKAKLKYLFPHSAFRGIHECMCSDIHHLRTSQHKSHYSYKGHWSKESGFSANNQKY